MDKPLTHVSSATRSIPESDERCRDREIESLNAMLAVYFKGCLDAASLFNLLKEAQEQGKQYLVRSARCRLEGSFMESKLPFKFSENGDGTVRVELLNGQANLNNTPA